MYFRVICAVVSVTSTLVPQHVSSSCFYIAQPSPVLLHLLMTVSDEVCGMSGLQIHLP